MADSQNGGEEEHNGANEPAIPAKPKQASPIEPPHSDALVTGGDVPASDGCTTHPITNQQPSISEEIFIDRIKRSDLWMIRLTGAIVFLAVVSAIVSYFQLREMIRAYTPVKEAADAANKSADAAKQSLDVARQALSRPWVFVHGQSLEFVRNGSQGKADNAYLPNAGQPDKFHITFKFTIENAGSSPAIIQNIISHAYVMNDSMDGDEPDPNSERGKHLQETSALQASVEGTGQYDPSSLIIPANTSSIISNTFLFNRTQEGFPTHIPRKWFLCIVQYKDVFGYDRETGYFVQQNGVLFAVANRSYNYWK